MGACADGTGRVEYEPVPRSIQTPDRVETRLGTLEFFDGYPDPSTVAAVYDNLDFQRGVRAFLDALPIASLHAMREGLFAVGAVNGTVGIFENLMNSRTLFLTANTESSDPVWIPYPLLRLRGSFMAQDPGLYQMGDV